MGSQLRMLANSPLGEQISLLDHILKQEDIGLSELAGMVNAWSARDAAHFETLLVQRMRLWPSTFEVLISERNRNWLPLVVAMSHDGVSRIIVVGLLHLFGPTGLPALVEQQGMRMSRCAENA